MSLMVVTTTVGNADDAKRLARVMVEEKLAACVQVLQCRSVFDWEGVSEDTEWRLEAKTTAAGAYRLMARLGAVHPYDEPEIIAVAVAAASAGYTAWVEASVRT